MPADALDLLPDGAVVADGDGKVVRVSAVAARMLGVDPDDSVGRPLADVLALMNRDGEAWLGWNKPYAGLPTRTAVPEQSWLLPDGTEVLVSARLHREHRLGPVATVAVSLRSGRGRARLDRERSDLVATVAHELRSPLTGVKGFVNALLSRWDRLNEDQKQLMLTTVSADADRLSRLIAELLDVARIDTGRLQLHRRPTDPVLKAQRVITSTTSGGGATPIHLVVEDDAKIDADPDKVTQVLANLVENGMRHGSGAVTITIARDADPAYLAITVTDEGQGIPVELRRRAVTKFWTSTGHRGGSGLGLYIVNGLVRAHGGAVVIDDRPGGGNRVTTTWPVVGDLDD